MTLASGPHKAPLHRPGESLHPSDGVVTVVRMETQLLPVPGLRMAQAWWKCL